MYLERLGAAPAVAMPCPRGEVLTRDGCEPARVDAPASDPVRRRITCPTGTIYDAPTDSCLPMPCPDGWARDATGMCVPLPGRTEPTAVAPPPPPPEGEPAPTELPGGATGTGGGSGGGGLQPPGSGWWQPFSPTTTSPVGGGASTVTVEAPGAAEAPKGFGLLELLIATGLGVLVSRAVRDQR